MSDSDDKKSGGRKPLTLNKTTGAGTVRQNFSHGRSKSVVVEKKRRKIIAPPKPSDAPKEEAKKSEGPTDVERAARALGLSVDEYVKRQKALEAARAQEAEREEKKKKEAEERARRAREEKEALEAKKREEEEEARRAAEEEAREKTEVKKKPKPREQAAASAPSPEEVEARAAKGGRTLEDLGGRIKKAKQQPVKTTRSKGEPKRRRRQLTITSALAGDEDRQRSLASMKRARQREKEKRQQGDTSREKVTRDVTIPEAITVQELANRMAERAADVVKYLMKQGTMAKMNDVLDADTAELIAEDFGHRVNRVSEDDVEADFIRDDVDPEDSLEPRAPVVAVMGHVDHGKTSLLDALRSTDVAGGEAGGITQHIGAYQVTVESGDKVTFLDTPGHAAFSAMRARGAQVTDIVILVVAADDGIMPQTIEAINHCRAAGTPMIVAVNKMDKPDANPQKILQDLLQHEVIVEAMGGETQAIEVSAKKRTGLSNLVEAITLQAELLDLKANPDRKADGVVIESKLDKGRGPVATVLVKRGTLARGEIVVAGDYWGKVRALVDERNQQRKDVFPAEPIEILGLNGTPEPGELFAVVSSEARAREITDYRQRKRRQVASAGVSATASLEQMMSRLQEKETAELALVIKADVQGSVEAIVGSLEKLGNEDVQARAIHTGVGGISESDILLAKASEAPIIGFNVRANKQARDLAEREGVEIRYYSIIYDLLDDIKDVMEGMLSPELRETFLGNAEILEVFNITKVGKVAGCRVTEGKVERGAKVRLLRDDVVIHEGELSTLKRFKDEVKEVPGGQECGMGFANYHDLKVGDIIECFRVTEVARTLD